eukprot:4274461-Amphidinium_carterae.1
MPSKTWTLMGRVHSTDAGPLFFSANHLHIFEGDPIRAWRRIMDLLAGLRSYPCWGGAQAVDRAS